MAGLFSSIQIKGISIKNRIVMPPMVCFDWAGDDGFVSDRHLAHYEARAKGGAGLIIIEATCVSRNGRLADSQLGIWSDEHIDGLREIAERCRRYGARVIVQLHHAGYKTPVSVTCDSIAPSAYSDGTSTAREMTIDELHGIQEDFVKAALRVRQAGLDGIEFHGAHGYLINQFVSPVTNKRRDEYGGSLDNRMRFAAEIIKRVRDEAGNSLILGCRMGGNNPTLADGIEAAEKYAACGIDLLHVSNGISNGTLPQVPEGFQYNWIVYCGTEIRKHVNIPVIAVNDIRTPERAAYLIEKDMSDFAAIGRGMLVDPDWAQKAGDGGDIIACLKCPKCQWFINSDRCPKLQRNN